MTLWFVFLTAVVFVIVTGIAMAAFQASLTSALDSELAALAVELDPVIEFEVGGNLDTTNVPGKFGDQPYQFMPTIQIFDTKGKLLREHGPAGPNSLRNGVFETRFGGRGLRSRSSEIFEKGRFVGFLQLQVPTEERDQTVKQFGITMAFLTPVLLFALGLSGYAFSGQAVRPVQETFEVLRTFLADAGHELKTPLAIIQASAENLSEEVKDRSESLERVTVIERSTERMSHLVQDMLLLAKMEIQQPTAKFVAIQLHDLISRLVKEFEPRFASSERKLILDSAAEAKIVGDKDSIYRMFANLLENGLRYSEQGDSVAIALRKIGRKVQVEITDTGIGIPADCIPHIFERFYRVEKSRSRSAGGSGLGLAIVKAIAESHHGTIEVESKEGVGTKFTVTLPAED